MRFLMSVMGFFLLLPTFAGAAAEEAAEVR
mgnify:CR=1 FL=1